MKSSRKKVSIIRNSNPGQDIVGTSTRSPGSPLRFLGRSIMNHFTQNCQEKKKQTSTVMVGKRGLVASILKVQTMTTTDTKDIAGTVEQVMRIGDKGADIVRITVQGRKKLMHAQD